MSVGPTSTAPSSGTSAFGRGAWLGIGAGLICIAVVVAAMAGSLAGGGSGGGHPAGSAASGAGSVGASGSASPAASGPVDVASYLLPARVAPALALTDQDARPWSLTADRGQPTLVFFGYTHCPDVCPATVGTIGQAMTSLGGAARAVFVTVDPARDTPTWLAEYVKYLPAGFTALTGTDAEIASTAAAWHVQYAKEETGDPSNYGMSHTADVWLVDAGGSLRAKFPFGTGPDVMAAVVRSVQADIGAAGTPGASATSTTSPASTPTPAPSEANADDDITPAGVEIVSSSIWSGPPGPIIFTISINGVRLDDPTMQPTVQLATMEGATASGFLSATVVRPPGVTAVSFVAEVPVAKPGVWRIVVRAMAGGRLLQGDAVITAKDPGTSAAIGAPAPTVHTPTLDDVGGDHWAVSTDPAPDLRLSSTSTTDALAAHEPFVLIVDSVRFKVSPVCGRAVAMARYLQDRWPGVAFIHLEPYRYSVVTDTPVLTGSLGDPSLADPAAGWGIGGDPWGPLSVPWIFVVDGNGTVRAKYQGVFGSDDVDVMVSMLAAGG